MLSITFDHALPTEVPRQLPVYAAQAAAPASQALDEMARAWPGVREPLGPMRRAGDWTATESGALRLLYHSLSGAARISVGSARARRLEGSARFTLDDASSARIARAFLRTIKLVDDDVDRLATGPVTHLYRQLASVTGERSPVEILDAGVCFMRVIAGVPVVGPGGQVMIKVVAPGTIAGASRVFRRLGPSVGAVPLTTPADALMEFERRLRRRRRLDEKIRVRRAQFGYFEAGRSQRQKFFEPVYVFVFETGGSEPLKAVEIVPGSRSPRESWWPDSSHLVA